MKAFITILSSHEYLPGVLSLLQSLQDVQTTYPVFLLTAVSLSETQASSLTGRGFHLIPSQRRFVIPADTLSNIQQKHWRHTFAKLELYSLSGFDKIIYLDADMLVCRNIDHLFDTPHLTFSTGSAQIRGYEDWTLPNSGLMVLEPRPGLSDAIFNTWPAVAAVKPNFGDQDLLHAHFRSYLTSNDSWKLSTQYNCFVFLLDAIIRERNFNMNFSSPDDKTIYVLHFALRGRPWQMSNLNQLKYLLGLMSRRKWNEVKAFFKYRAVLQRALAQN